MKALITGIICLSVLAGCVNGDYHAMSNVDDDDPSTGKLDQVTGAFNGVCNANKLDGVFVILIDSKGQAKGFACKTVGNAGNKAISQPPKVGKFDNKTLKPEAANKDIGKLRKWTDGNGDPCYVWYVNRTRYHVCWP